MWIQKREEVVLFKDIQDLIDGYLSYLRCSSLQVCTKCSISVTEARGGLGGGGVGADGHMKTCPLRWLYFTEE